MRPVAQHLGKTRVAGGEDHHVARRSDDDSENSGRTRAWPEWLLLVMAEGSEATVSCWTGDSFSSGVLTLPVESALFRLGRCTARAKVPVREAQRTNFPSADPMAGQIQGRAGTLHRRAPTALGRWRGFSRERFTVSSSELLLPTRRLKVALRNKPPK
jgi:hypothetical protein